MSHSSSFVPYKNRILNLHREVMVYRNLRGRSIGKRWSIMQDGLVVGHAGDVTIKEARFVVREAGRQRVIRDKRKNVHAFVAGKLTPTWYGGDFEGVSYDPYTRDCFFSLYDGRAVYTADFVSLGAKCFAQGAK
ncbi:MAG: hypothetical protein JO112_20240 [Planctomycetes bacterium]|nr:hypothetical protein [Planctomycetota bacterium]